MTALAQQQQALLNALFAWPDLGAINNVADCAVNTRARGLKAYQTNGHVLAERALRSAYPVVAQLLGEDSFSDLARALWHAHPPVRGDVAWWGMQLPAFLEGSADLADEPYLSDVATVEWALHRCATAPDAIADLGTFSLLASVEPTQLQLKLAPGSAVFFSSWPVGSILSAHLEQTPSFAEVGALLRVPVAQSTLVWRAGLRPRARLVVAGEDALLGAVLANQSLGYALAECGELDFSAWLPMAVQSGLVLGVHPFSATTPSKTDGISHHDKTSS